MGQDIAIDDQIIRRCCLAAEKMLSDSGIKNVKFDPATMKQYLTIQPKEVSNENRNKNN